MRRPLIAAVALAALTLVSCRLDPVPQEIVDQLGPEEGTPSETHRAGQPCVVCHGPYGGVAPQMWFGGTLYTLDGDTLSPAAGVRVQFFDASGTSAVPPSACSNEAGNFYLPKKDVEQIAFPVKVRVGTRGMASLIGRDGSCATCHKHPDRFDDQEDPPLNAATGASRDSAGVILVLDPADLEQCQ